jgi:hypothetical protein
MMFFLLVMMGNCWTWGLGVLNEIPNLYHTPNTNKQIVELEFTSFVTNIVPKINYKSVEVLVSTLPKLGSLSIELNYSCTKENLLLIFNKNY